MAKARICPKCFKQLANRHSLCRHKKTCGSGMRLTSTTVPIPAIIPHDRNGSSRDPLFEMKHLHHVTTPNEHGRKKLIEIMSKVDDEEDDSDDDDADDGQSDDADDGQSEDSEMDDAKLDEFLWQKFVIKCHNRDWSIFQCLSPYLHVYYYLPNDTTYQEIMEDVKKNETMMSFPAALGKAIKKHDNLIITSVENCRGCDHGDNELTIWCAMGKRAIPYGCQWFTGSKCLCDECNGQSLLSIFRQVALLFHAMDAGDVIQKVIKEVGGEEEDIMESIQNVMQKNKELILEKYYEARDELRELNWDKCYQSEYFWK